MKKCFVLLILSLFAASGFSQTVKISSLDWPPFCGSVVGKKIHHDIVDKAFAKVGYEVKWSILPWKRATDYAEKGTVDAVACMWYTDERTKVYYFSEPTRVANELVLFKRKSDSITFDGDFTKMRQYKFGAVNGFGYPEAFLNSGLKLDYVNSDVQNLKKMLVGRIDLLLNDKIQTYTLIKENMPDKIDSFEIVEPPVSKNDIFLGFSKNVANGEKLKMDFDKGLKLIEASGEIETIKKTYGIK